MRLEALARSALGDALGALEIPIPAEIPVDRPARPEHGDLSSRVAFLLARQVRKSPPELAAELARLASRPPFRSVRAEGGS